MALRCVPKVCYSLCRTFGEYNNFVATCRLGLVQRLIGRTDHRGYVCIVFWLPGRATNADCDVAEFASGVLDRELRNGGADAFCKS